MSEIVSVKRTELTRLAVVYANGFNAAVRGEGWNTPMAEAFLLHCFKKQPDLFFVAKQDTVLMGGVLGELKPWWNGNWLTNVELFVAPTFQRKGIARKLMHHLVEEARQKYSVVRIEAVTFNSAGFPLDWYKRLGFTLRDDMVLISGDATLIQARLGSKTAKRKRS